MKKKALIYMGCIAMLAGMLMGCGTNAETSNPEAEKETVQESVATQTPEAATDPAATEVPDETATEAPGLAEGPEATTIPEPKEVEPKLYERLSAWDDFYEEYNCYYTAIQIEDMFLHPGMMGSELAEVVTSGKDTAITPLSVEKLMEPDEEVSSRDTKKVTYYRNETPWFNVYVRNYAGDLLSFGDCIVSLVVPCDAAMEYCRFFDGTYTLNSIKEINYKDYDDFSATLESAGYTVEKNGSTWEVSSIDEFCPASLSEEVLYWTKQSLETELLIDTDTGYVTDVSVPAEWESWRSECEMFTELVPDDLDWSTQENEKRLNTYTTNVLAERYEILKEAEKCELVAVYKGFLLVYRLTDSSFEIPVSYVAYRVKDIKADYVGNLIMPETPPSLYAGNESSRVGSYAYLLGQIETQYKKDRYTDLLCEYEEGLIREHKKMTSFADATEQQICHFIDSGIRLTPSWWSARVEKVAPLYVSFGDGEKEGGHFDGTRLWIIYYTLYDDGSAELAHVELQDLYLDMEANSIAYKNYGCAEGQRRKGYYDMRTIWELDGTPEENKWVTELLPASFAEKLEEMYGEKLDRDSIDQTK